MFKRRGFARALARRKPGTMNGAEGEYSNVLALRKRDGEILAAEFEAVTFKLAPDLRYTPDFMVVMADGTIEFHEVKASRRVGKKKVEKPHLEDDARAKYLVAADRFYQFRFAIACEIGGAWTLKYAD